MRVVILGGSGFVGRHTAGHLLAAGHDVRVVGRRGGKDDPRYVRHDLFDNEKSLVPLLANADACIHMACDLVPGSAEAAGWAGIERNLHLADRLAAACIEARVGRLLFASSGGTIYGNHAPGARESDACLPIGLYGAQKLAVEGLLHARLTRSRCRLVVLRVANPYGAGQENQKAQGVIGRILSCLRDDAPFTVWGDGSQVRDYIHVSDVGAAFCKALDYEGERVVFNIGSGVGLTMRQLIGACEYIAGARLEHSFQPAAEHEVDTVFLDITRAVQSLEWKPAVLMQDGLRQYFATLKESL